MEKVLSQNSSIVSEKLEKEGNENLSKSQVKNLSRENYSFSIKISSNFHNFPNASYNYGHHPKAP